MNIKVYISTVCIVSILAVPAFSQSAKLHFDLDHLAKKAVETVNINLDSSMLGFASKAMSKKEPDERGVKKLIEGLNGIWVRSFRFDTEGAYSQAEVNAIRNQLEGPGWSCIVKVENKRPKGETADICLRKDDDKILGLAIVVAEPKELTIVNIAGSITLDQLSKLQGKFGIPEMPVTKETQQKPK